MRQRVVRPVLLTAGLIALAVGASGAEIQGAYAASPAVTYSYDAAGRLSSVSTPQGSATYSYDAAGNMLSITRSTSAALAPAAATPAHHRAPAPHAATVTPTSTRAWSHVTVTGSGFQSDLRLNRVRIGGLEAQIIAATPNRLVALAPPGTHGGTVQVITPGGVSTAPTHIKITSPTTPSHTPAPKLTPAKPLRAQTGDTALAGRTVDLSSRPLSGVVVSVGSTHTRTDSQGRFLLTGLTPGHVELFIDARHPTSGGNHGVYEEGADVTHGQTTRLSWTIWIPRLDLTHAIHIASPTRKPITYTSPTMPGLRVHIPAGTVIKDHWGRVVHQLSLTPIPINRTPLPLAPGMSFFYTLQPADSTVTGPGIRIDYPNYTHEQPGTAVGYVLNDAAKLGFGWYTYAMAHVTPDGRSIVLPPNVTLHYIGFPGVFFNTLCKSLGFLCPTAGGGPSDGDPVDLGTGLFTTSHTDLALPDVMPISITRTYRQGDGNPDYIRAFGYSQSDNLDLFIAPEINPPKDPTTPYDLQLPSGADIRYLPSSTPGDYLATEAPPGFVGSTLQHTSETTFTIQLTDGTTLDFGTKTPALIDIKDQYGNQITIERDAAGRLQQVTSPNGRWIAFTWGPCAPGAPSAQGPTTTCITQAQDNLGRTVKYGYDTATGRLTSVTDPANQVTTYTWGACPTPTTPSCYQITGIRDPRRITYISAKYDTAGRVVQQTLANGGTYDYTYTLDANGNVVATDATNPVGSVHHVEFTKAYATSDTFAFGTPLAQTTSVIRDPATHLVTDTIDPLGRQTHYTYDTLGNILAITQLYGTSHATTASFTYVPGSTRLASVTDPLKHVARFTYTTSTDHTNDTITATDPLGFSSTTTMNHGEPTAITDPLGHTTSLSYLAGDLVALADPAGDVTTRYLDGDGRMLQSTDPLGNTTTYTVDPLNQVTAVTDPLLDKTKFSYDANGNLLTITDPNNNVTTFQPDMMDNVTRFTDALKHEAKYGYDRLGELSSLTDRNGQMDNFTYDALGRLSQVTYAAGTPNQRTINYRYDPGNRVTQVTDSSGGTLTQRYDGLDHLLSQTGPTGSLTYTYNSAGLRKAMTVAGQPTVSYTYDADNRLRSIGNASGSVALGYDAADRQTSVTLPDGIGERFSYDAAGRAARIVYAKSGSVLGNLGYAYDADGEPTTVTGSFAASDLPAATIQTSTYNADNELTSFDGVSLTYDADGNLKSDGSNTYGWNARGQLTSVGGATTATLQYDPFGRRTSETVSGVQTQFLYDGANIVQELQGGTPVANDLAGLNLDEVFARSTASGTESLLTDALGSTIGLGNSTGAVATRYTYDPYGTPTAAGAASSNSFSFTGRERDPTGLEYDRARYYSPKLGRFISQDPLGPATSGPNLYLYAGNSPTSYTDPTGTQLLPGCVGGAAFNVGFDWFTSVISGRKYTLGQGLRDAALGCVQGAIGDWLGEWGSAADDFGAAAGDIGEGRVTAEFDSSAQEDFSFTDGASCATHSFSGRTKVLMRNRHTERLRNINPGDQVIATNPRTGKSVVATVSRVFRHHDSHLDDIFVAGADRRLGVIHGTAGHPFWDQTDDAWVKSARLQPGDRLESTDGQFAKVVAVRSEPGARWMYDLTVSTVHTFYVVPSGTPVLVHNCDDVNYLKYDSKTGAIKLGGALPNASELSRMSGQQLSDLRDQLEISIPQRIAEGGGAPDPAHAARIAAEARLLQTLNAILG